MNKQTLHVTGMHCNGCVRSVTNALRRIAGVSNVEVLLPENSAKVEFDEKETTVEALRNIIREIGYDVKE